MAGRVLLSQDGRSYRKACADAVLMQRVPRHRLLGKLAVKLTVNPPDRRARDLDNLPKGILDGLKHAGVIVDDSEIDDLHIVRDRVYPLGRIVVEIDELGEPTATRPLQFEESALAGQPF